MVAMASDAGEDDLEDQRAECSFLYTWAPECPFSGSLVFPPGTTLKVGIVPRLVLTTRTDERRDAFRSTAEIDGIILGRNYMFSNEEGFEAKETGKRGTGLS